MVVWFVTFSPRLLASLLSLFQETQLMVGWVILIVDSHSKMLSKYLTTWEWESTFQNHFKPSLNHYRPILDTFCARCWALPIGRFTHLEFWACFHQHTGWKNICFPWEVSDVVENSGCGNLFDALSFSCLCSCFLKGNGVQSLTLFGWKSKKNKINRNIN